MLLGLILGTASALAIIYLLIRLYIAGRENAKKQFLYDLTYGDWPLVSFVGRIGERPARKIGGGGSAVGGRAGTRTNLRHASHSHDETGL
jgi:hypothetical protein